jgi:hypothetical protein
VRPAAGARTRTAPNLILAVASLRSCRELACRMPTMIRVILAGPGPGSHEPIFRVALDCSASIIVPSEPFRPFAKHPSLRSRTLRLPSLQFPWRREGLFKHVPAGWSGWSVPPRRRRSRSVGWADEGSRGAGWKPAGHVEARRATGAAVITEAASRDSEARGPGGGSPGLGGGARRARIRDGGMFRDGAWHMDVHVPSYHHPPRTVACQRARLNGWFEWLQRRALNGSRHEPSILAKPNPRCRVCVLVTASVLQISRSDHKQGQDRLCSCVQ